MTINYAPTAADKSALVKKEAVFLSAPKFAVVGASNNPTKFGTKVGSPVVLWNAG
jgi:hypothetical protein